MTDQEGLSTAAGDAVRELSRAIRLLTTGEPTDQQQFFHALLHITMAAVYLRADGRDVHVIGACLCRDV